MFPLPDPDNRDNQTASDSSRKRPSEASQETSSSTKRHRPHYPSTIPSRFWDNLSKVALTRNALRELDRRQEKRQIASPSADQERPRVSRLTRSTRRSLARQEYRTQSADQLLGQFSPACLKEIRRFSSHGGPDLSDLIGVCFPGSCCPAPPQAVDDMSSSQTSHVARKRSVWKSRPSPYSSRSTRRTTLTSARTKSTGPYDRAFQQHLIDHHVLPDGYEYPNGQLPPEPENMAEIRQALARRRASLSPSRFTDEDFRRFKRQQRTAQGETEVVSDVVPIIEGAQDRRNVARDNAFRNLEHLTDDTLVPGNPDLYYGARPEQLNPGIRSALSGQIVPTAQEELPIAPNFFLQVKGPGATADVAPRQVCYDGALGARGIQSLQSYGEAEKLYDNKAYALTCYYMAGILGIHTSHPIPPSHPGGQPGFVTTEVKQYLLTADVESFRQGAAAYRNGIDWAKSQRDEAIDRANERANQAVQADEGASQLPGPPPDVDVKQSFTSQVSATNTTADGLTGLSMPASQGLSSYEPHVFADEPSTEFPSPNALAHGHTMDSPRLLSQGKVPQAV
ncbi:hypothetical protein CCMA1212_000745 [Trichoderma ghanense]|uniref:Uncharacterized protein n=1 Tax=Trichoderma ghanense TaxID=65468 RepID=A0ABY2HK44_9HYPO